MNEKLVALKIVDVLTIDYVIVLSSVLFGYGTFICINTIDIHVIFNDLVVNSRYCNLSYALPPDQQYLPI